MRDTLVGSVLQNKDVIQSKSGTPEELRMYAADVHGPLALVNAAEDLLAGKHVAFAICSREPEGTGAQPTVKELIELAVPNGRKCVRFCGINGNPVGVGSFTVHGSGLLSEEAKYTPKDLPLIVAAIACMLARNPWYFRVE
jgi:hypothetical protein